ncbi:hypothetical protein HPB52_011744 [Rhipicephalus sanguineus]|uniref:BTB domain-containing protein n=1 Tax=Rhipicephalus sanguineus TaxID=34632 RepID=A0A9D4SSP3_RHISA|nr:hypothetical protein HPB52_011744 [Rhipicephalus sanguineus]
MAHTIRHYAIAFARPFWLSKCFETGDLADVEISVESCHFPRVKGTFKAHKMILAAQNDLVLGLLLHAGPGFEPPGQPRTTRGVNVTINRRDSLLIQSWDPVLQRSSSTCADTVRICCAHRHSSAPPLDPAIKDHLKHGRAIGHGGTHGMRSPNNPLVFILQPRQHGNEGLPSLLRAVKATARNLPESVFTEYFYSGRLEVKTVHEAACTRTAAHKYLVPQLEEECLKFMNCGMTPDDVCPFLDYVLTVSEEALATHATIVIVRDSLKVLSSTTFKSSTEATVKYVLKHVTNVSEALVLQAAYAWGRHCLTLMKKARAPKRGRLGDHEKGKLRTILEPLFPQLRFLALTPKEFTDDPNRWGILTDAEARAILSNIVAEGSMPMPAGFCKIRQARA